MTIRLRAHAAVALCAAGLLLVGVTTKAEFSGMTRVASGLEFPLFATAPYGDTDRLFVLEKGTNDGPDDARVRIVDLNTNTVRSTPFLTVPDVFGNGEAGLVGLAFHPDYATNGKFYTYAVIHEGVGQPLESRVYEYTVSNDPNVANPDPVEVIRWTQPNAMHNAGWIGFNPAVSPGQKQYLYIASGDGGGGQSANGQKNTELYGGMLRIDVDGDDFPDDPLKNYSIPADNPYVGVDGQDEMWSIGLRNPWRNSFDRETGDLWIGDVGQGLWEEINFQPASSTGGENYGWARREGSQSYLGGQSLPGDIDPFYEYPHNGGSAAVVGGYVYRGPDADEQGRYFFGDNPTNDMWAFDPSDPYGTIASLEDELPGNPVSQAGVFNLVSFGEDAVGNLYAMLANGSVYRFDPGKIAGDYNGDGAIGDLDYHLWASTYGSTSYLDADGNGDGVVNAADYTFWRDSLAKYGAVYAETEPFAVPEPSAALLASVAAVGLLRRQGGRLR